MTFATINPATSAFTFHPTPDAAHQVARLTDVTAVTNAGELSGLTGAELVALFNAVAAYQGEPLVKRFAAKADALRRTWAALVAAGAVEADPEPAPADPEPAAAPALQAEVQEPAPAAAPAAPAPKAKKVKPAPAPRRWSITLAPKAEVKACRAGTKQATLVDLLFRSGGASMSELREALTGWQDQTIKSGLSWDMNAIKGYGIRTTHENGYERWLATDYAGQGTFHADSHPDDNSDADKAALLADNLANGYDPNELFPVYHLVLPAGMTAPVPHDAKPDAVAAIREWANANYSKSYGASALVECFTDDELRTEFKDLAAAKRWAKLQSSAKAEAGA